MRALGRCRTISLCTALATAAVASACLAGCGLQLGGAAHIDSHGTWRGAGALDMRLVQMRGSGPVLGVHVPVAIDSSDGPVVLRAALLEMGAHVGTSGPFAFEFLYDFGLGGPVARSYRGTGVYFGMATAALLRLHGSADKRAVFATGFLDIDLVLTVRAGGWLAPEGASQWIVAEAGGELALRFTLGSDLFSAEHWREGT